MYPLQVTIVLLAVHGHPSPLGSQPLLTTRCGVNLPHATGNLTTMRKVLLAALALVLVGCSSAQPLAVDLSPSAERGLKLSQQSGCASCHGSDFGGGTGPTWQGIIGQSVAFKGGESGVVDREYLIESIKYPDKKKRVGYSVVMPYNNLTDEQISDIVDYIEALSN
jgi:cytochrome c553